MVTVLSSSEAIVTTPDELLQNSLVVSAPNCCEVCPKLLLISSHWRFSNKPINNANTTINNAYTTINTNVSSASLNK